MNFYNFSKWLLEPNFPKSSVIVIDSAKYCVESGKRPTLGSLKEEIIDWVVNHGVKIDFTLIKS